MRIEGAGAASVVEQARRQVALTGNDVTVGRAHTREFAAAQLVMHDTGNALALYDGFFPGLAALEALHLIGGQAYTELIKNYGRRLGSVRWDYGSTAVGPRLRGQMPWVIQQLCGEEGTRQAVATVWDKSDVPNDLARWLCTTGVQFLERSGYLTTVVTMRSCDVMHGLPYNLFAFAQFARTCAHAVALTPGSLVVNVGSLHANERHLPLCKNAACQDGAWLDGIGQRLHTRNDYPAREWLMAAAQARSLLHGSGKAVFDSEVWYARQVEEELANGARPMHGGTAEPGRDLHS